MTLNARPKNQLMLVYLGIMALILANCDAGSRIPLPISDATSSTSSADAPLGYIRSGDPDASNVLFEANRSIFEYDREASLDIREVSRRIEDGLTIVEITYASPKGGRVPPTRLSRSARTLAAIYGFTD
jgi:hypothetical protein